MEKKKKKEPWIRKRHKIVTEIARVVLVPYCRLRYGVRLPKSKDLIREQSLILLNHQTPFDQFFVGMFFRDPVYYMATEDIFSNGFISKVIKFVVAPIPIKKQTTDVQAVMNCIKVVREGGSIAIAPEGNRTYSGKTEYMNPAIAPLVKKLGLPLVLFRIDGGYGKEPRWSDVVRKGKLECTIPRILRPEELKEMSNEEIFTAIQEGLYVNEACTGPEYHHKQLAQYLERAVYVCPECGLSEFESHNDLVTCKKCGLQVRYLPTKELEGVNKPFPFKFVNDWYEYQKDYVNQLDTRSYTDTPIYEDWVKLSRVIVYKRKELICKDARLAIYGDRIEAADMVMPFEEISTVAVLGRNKLNIYHGKELYQIKSSKRFNALKYVNLFYRSRNLMRGDENGKFLGL
ncbi:MAG: 1-acyl-sn-glycerol-3-phosphate acyltransferase [Oscillospiraceae bacterium]|nr:1-acyl-sn-glycerol-3-phosphate acyltransferase [Oscillospiraceae bacterium]